MGIVQRQGIKNSIIRFAGVLVGVLSMLYVYPLNREIYGYAQFLVHTAQFFVPFASFGTLSLIVKFYPEFNKDSPHNHGFLPLILIASSLFFLIFGALVFLFNGPFYEVLDMLQMDTVVLRANETYIAALLFIWIMIYFFTNYISNFGRIVVPTLLQNFLFKIFLPLLILAYVLEKVSMDWVAKGLILFFFVVLILIVIYAQRLKTLKFGWDKAYLVSSRLKRMGSYMLFGAFNRIGSVLAFRIDAIMITTLLGVASTGTYFMVLIMASIIDIPSQSILKITGPIISKGWEERDVDAIEGIYKKASINLLIAGFAIFLVGWYTIESFFSISINPESFEGGKWIFLFLAGGKLIDMLTSVNNPIIVYSKYFKFNLLFVLILGLLNVVLNYYLIGEYDVVGAAIASFGAMFIFNLIKLLFIYFKMDMHPFTKEHIRLFIIASGIFIVFYLMPEFGNPYVSIAVNGAGILLLYGLLVYYFKVSEDLNQLLSGFLHKIFKSQ